MTLSYKVTGDGSPQKRVVEQIEQSLGGNR